MPVGISWVLCLPPCAELSESSTGNNWNTSPHTVWQRSLTGARWSCSIWLHKIVHKSHSYSDTGGHIIVDGPAVFSSNWGSFEWTKCSYWNNMLKKSFSSTYKMLFDLLFGGWLICSVLHKDMQEYIYLILYTLYYIDTVWGLSYQRGP